MKYCPDCRSTYTDKTLSYCLQDGHTLRDFRDANSQEKTAILNKETQNSLKQEKINPTEKLVTENKDESRVSNLFGESIPTFLWLIIGAFLGVGGIYIWQTTNAKPTEVPVIMPQTTAISKSSLDTLKYRAETAPESIVKQYGTALPKDASDFYILGKAYLKLKNYEEAKKNFIIARNNLREVQDAEARVILDSDITQGLMIAQDVPVQAAYERVAKTSPLVETTNQTNTNQ
jgi:hypothetical protein